MASNDLVLLDSLIQKDRERAATVHNEGDHFELFCFEHVLKDYELSDEDIEEGWVDDADDGGIDGLFVFIDGQLITSAVDENGARRNPLIEVRVITAKHGHSFKQAPMNALAASLPELFDLRKSEDELSFSLNDDILELRKAFRETYINLAAKSPRLKITVTYASRGDTSGINPNVYNVANVVRDRLDLLFSQREVTVEFLGASELLRLARRQNLYSLRLRFTESTISRARTNYVLLSTLSDYVRFITDEDGNLRRYLFEANVRDYLGSVQVNSDIEETLRREERKEEVDFWWLNNGITLLASNATIAGKELSLENVQIVNGLQTTETIYQYFVSSESKIDDRAVLIKVIVTENEEVKDRIIKATNYQNSVELATLRATEKIQRDIEHILGDCDWYYDRRRNFYKNQGRAAERIVSMSYVAFAIRTVVLQDPASAHRGKTRFMRFDDQYRSVFNPEWPLRVFAASVQIVKGVDNRLSSDDVFPEGAPIRGVRRTLK